MSNTSIIDANRELARLAREADKAQARYRRSEAATTALYREWQDAVEAWHKAALAAGPGAPDAEAEEGGE